jgi:hypothetical protein
MTKGLRIGDKVKPSYPVDNFTYGFVRRIIEKPQEPVFANTRIIAVYWPDEGKEVCFCEESLELF